MPVKSSTSHGVLLKKEVQGSRALQLVAFKRSREQILPPPKWRRDRDGAGSLNNSIPWPGHPDLPQTSRIAHMLSSGGSVGQREPLALRRANTTAILKS